MNWFLYWWNKEATPCVVVNGHALHTHAVPGVFDEYENEVVPMFKLCGRYVGTCSCGRKLIS